MKKYEYLPHTADTKFLAYGKTLEEAFGNAALAMMNVMVEPKSVKAATAKKITAEGDDIKALLYNFLEEFLIIMDSKNLFLTTVKDLAITHRNGGYRLTATALGDDAGKYQTIGPQVKAITYNDMRIEEKEGECKIQAVVDI